MQPGPPSKSKLRFPSQWEGTWKDSDGKILEISGLGKMQIVTFRPGLHHPPFPLPDIPGASTEDLAARFFVSHHNGYCLEVTVGEPEIGPFLQLYFFLPEDNRMRPAELTDAPRYICIQPQVFSYESHEGTELSWAHPLLMYQFEEV